MPDIYKTSLALLTDLYQITMGYGYWKHNMGEREAVFHLYFRDNPFGSKYTIAAGLQTAIEFIQSFEFTPSDLNFLKHLKGNDDLPLLEEDYLQYLAQMKFSCDIDAVPEGTIVFPNEPLVRVKGPLLQAQWIETALLTIINFQTLIATKAHKVCQAAEDPVLEFGLRRAQGIDGGLSASRAAYIGGCAATSNVLAGKLFDIPVKGTHAHSWVMSFDTEMEAFNAYAEAMPNNATLLVDTYDTIEGVAAAITIGNKLRQQGHDLVAIRLDSGDLCELSIEARKVLDEAGFKNTKIVASSDLDENIIIQLKRSGAQIDLWGVGTKLVTAYQQPALGGVYKLAAIRDKDNNWKRKLKLSSTPEKTSSPGIQNIARYSWLTADKWKAFADIIFDEELGLKIDEESLISTIDKNGCRSDACFDLKSEDAKHEILLKEIFRKGQLVYKLPDIKEIRDHVNKSFDSVWLTDDKHPYFVALDHNLLREKEKLITNYRSVTWGDL